MNCQSCHHSIEYWSGDHHGLYCDKFHKETEVIAECEEFVYEPGTDAEEGNK